MAFLFDDHGQAVAYGWYGKAQEPETYVSTHIVFGRAILSRGIWRPNYAVGDAVAANGWGHEVFSDGKLRIELRTAEPTSQLGLNRPRNVSPGIRLTIVCAMHR
jgi:hypothetical protein